MYKFVDIKGIVKGKVIRRLDELTEHGITVTMSKQTLDNVVDSILSEYLKDKSQSLNELDIIVENSISVKLPKLI